MWRLTTAGEALWEASGTLDVADFFSELRAGAPAAPPTAATVDADGVVTAPTALPSPIANGVLSLQGFQRIADADDVVLFQSAPERLADEWSAYAAGIFNGAGTMVAYRDSRLAGTPLIVKAANVLAIRAVNWDILGAASSTPNFGGALVLPATTRAAGVVRLTDADEVTQGARGDVPSAYRMRALMSAGDSLLALATRGLDGQSGSAAVLRLSKRNAEVEGAFYADGGLGVGRGGYGLADGGLRWVGGSRSVVPVSASGAAGASVSSTGVTGTPNSLFAAGGREFMLTNDGVFRSAGAPAASGSQAFAEMTGLPQTGSPPADVVLRAGTLVQRAGEDDKIYWVDSAQNVYTSPVPATSSSALALTRIGSAGMSVSGIADDGTTLFALTSDGLAEMNPQTGSVLYSPTALTPEQADARGDARYLRSTSALDALVGRKANIASPVFTGNPQAPTPPAGDADQSIATTGFVSDAVAGAVPAGTVLDFAGAAAPSGYLACDGAAVSRTVYADLFAAIGVAWGRGNGLTTFNVPDLRRRATIGAGGVRQNGPGVNVGDTGGAELVRLSSSQMPSHTHTYQEGQDVSLQFGTSGSQRDRRLKSQTETAQNTGAAGGGQWHPNMPPSAVVNKIIKH